MSTSQVEVLLTETVLQWRPPDLQWTQAPHTRGGVGYVAGEATDERLGQYPRAEASAAETRTPASGQDHGVGSQTPKSAPEAAGEPSGKQTTPRNLSLLKMQNEEHQEKTCEDITPH